MRHDRPLDTRCGVAGRHGSGHRVVDLLRGRGGDLEDAVVAAVAQHDDAVGDRTDVVQVVRDHVTWGAVPGRASGRRMLQTMPAKGALRSPSAARSHLASWRGGGSLALGSPHGPYGYRDVPLRLPGGVTAQTPSLSRPRRASS